jgi:DNA-binding XRE family transcriptional regulator
VGTTGVCRGARAEAAARTLLSGMTVRLSFTRVSRHHPFWVKRGVVAAVSTRSGDADGEIDRAPLITVVPTRARCGRSRNCGMDSTDTSGEDRYRERSESHCTVLRSARTGVTKPAQADQALAATIRRLRKRRGRTQEALAHEARITTAALGRIERGTANPQWTTVKQIAGALQFTVQELAAASENAEN